MIADMEFNFRGTDLDDMIFGECEMIVSER